MARRATKEGLGPFEERNAARRDASSARASELSIRGPLGVRVITPGLACLAMLVSSTGCLLSFPPPPGGGDGGTDDSGTCPACRRCVWRNVVVQAAGAPVARPSIDRGPGDALGVAWQLGALPEDVWGATTS